MKKKIIIFTTLVIVLAAIIYGCSCFFVPYKANITIEDIQCYEKTNDYVYDMSKENASKTLCTTVAEYENNIYYINPNTKYLCRMENGLGNAEVILFDEIEGFIFLNDQLYYTNKEHLYRKSLDTGETKEISDTYPNQVAITDEYIFYLNKSGELLRVTLDGNENKKVSSDVDQYIIKGDRIFFLRYFSKTLEDYGIINAMNADGTNQKVLIDIDMDGTFDVQNNSVYFGRRDKKIYRLNLFSGLLTQVNSYDYLFRFNLFNNSIYYGTNSNTGSQIFISEKIDGKEIKVYDSEGWFTPLAVSEKFIVYRKDFKEVITMLYRITDEKAIQLDTGGGFYDAVLFDNSVCLYKRSLNSDGQHNGKVMMFFNFDGELLYKVE